MLDSGIRANAAAPSKAPAENDMSPHNFLCLSLIVNNNDAPASADITANIDLVRIVNCILKIVKMEPEIYQNYIIYKRLSLVR